MPISPENILRLPDRRAFRSWLELNHASASECWLALKRGKPESESSLCYLNAVEEALCFGWIDSTFKVVEGVEAQRFSPRRPGSPWTELNKERVRRLEKLGLMTDAGRAVLPAMGPRSFRFDPDFEAALKAARCWTKFRQMPPLYQRVRAYNVTFYKKRDPEGFKIGLERLIAATKEGKTIGEWSDYGRLIGY